LADGICRDIAAPVPATSGRTLALSLLFLLAIAAFALRRTYSRPGL
jgi:hypothetical protein